ncbi:zinc ribbon domain-containing protein [Candidatus Riflebacteria bacterium]
MAHTKLCLECLSEIPADAEVCRYCGERIEGKVCPDCQSRFPKMARKCRWCGYVSEDPKANMQIQGFTITAELIPTIIFRGRFLCQKATISPAKIILSTPGILGLSTQEDEIPWKKVAGFNYHSGILWDSVQIETRGQQASVLTCLSKSDGERLREVLRKLKE